jgi:hypothetical protein
MRDYRSESKVRIVVPIIGLMVLIGLMSAAIAPLVTEYQIQTMLSGGVQRTSSAGTVRNTKEPYKISPFGVDYVVEGDAAQTHEFYATGIPLEQRAVGEAFETMTVFLSRKTRIDIAYQIDELVTARRPRAYVYSDLSRLVDSGNVGENTREFSKFTSPYQVSLNLDAGLYRVRHMFMREDVGSIHVTMTPNSSEPDAIVYEEYVQENTKSLYFDIMPGQLSRLTELRTAQEVNWAKPAVGLHQWQRNLPSPKETIQVQIRSEYGDWAFAELGLSGRNTAHKSVGGLPSSEISIKAGDLPYGLKKFKMYVVQSKTHGLDMFMEQLVNDMGSPVNRGDLVRIVLNGDVFGYMQIYEDFDTSLYEAGQFVEGPVIGYDTDSLIANPGHSWFVPRSYYNASEIFVDQEIDIGVRELTERFCPSAMGNNLAMGMFYAGMHGLGADTRFMFDFRRNCVNPVYKDFNIGINSLSEKLYEKVERFQFHPAMNGLRLYSILTPEWRPFTTTYASYFVERTENKPDKPGVFYYWTVTPPVMNYSNAPQRDAEFIMAMERIYGIQHTKRFASRIANYGRAISVVNASPHQSQTLPQIGKITMLSETVSFAHFRTLTNVSSSCGDSYIQRIIVEASDGTVTPDCRSLHRLAWRNELVSELLKVEITDAAGKMTTEEAVAGSRMTFLYQTERPGFVDMFFVERACGEGCTGELTLIDDETKAVFMQTKSIDIGTAQPLITNMSLMLQNVSLDEKVRVVYFAIPKLDRYQHLFPYYKGSGAYYGANAVAVVPLSTRPENEKSITNVASTVSYASVEEFFDVNGSVLRWKKNTPVPDKPIYIPAGYTWKVDEPLSIALAKRGCFEIWGNLEIADDATLDLTDSGNGWSGIHFYHNRDLHIQNLTVRNGGYNEEFVYCGSRQFTAVVGFYETTVHLKNLQIRQNMSEDALHLVHTDMILEDSSIVGSISDAVDSDFSAVVFRNFTIEGAGTLGENGGDALDFSGSLAQLHEVHLHRSSDKNLSVGENSVVNVYDSDLVGGNFGIAIKDASLLTVERTTIEGAKTGIGIYVKKPYYTRPVFDLAQNDVTFKDVGVSFNPEASAE